MTSKMVTVESSHGTLDRPDYECIADGLQRKLKQARTAKSTRDDHRIFKGNTEKCEKMKRLHWCWHLAAQLTPGATSHCNMADGCKMRS